MIFALPPGCEILDLAGPLQAFHEAIDLGADYRLELCAAVSEPAGQVAAAQPLLLSGLAPLGDVEAGDLVVVPGYPRAAERAPPAELVDWLRRAASVGARIASVCTGAFVLGAAGLLDGRRCTTHWKRQDALQRRYPKARVLVDRLYVADGSLLTSAGIASGIDLALAVIEEHHGPALAARVAREMVVYLRRDGGDAQQSVYLEHRNHLDRAVHAVQDHLVAHPESRVGLGELARLVHVSERTLSRRFRAATGTSVLAYRTRLRLERARALLAVPGTTMEAVAEHCGFADARQLRRLLRAAIPEARADARDRKV